ncbi:protein EFFECTOR OF TRANSCRIPTION 2-like [Wolffia australiana]
MGATTATSRRRRVVAWRCRLKREDCARTEYDSAFSKWQILIGPSDWENYALGINGAERYRTSNLSQNCSCPGVYELGVGRISSSSRRIDPKDVVVVYLGQAENIRTRLQHYGRTGSHLEQEDAAGILGKSAVKINERKPGLFTEVFSKGFYIVFRWTARRSKREAVDTEACMLDAFDYAWNRIGNAVCRYEDIWLKLDKISRPSPLNKFFTKLKAWKWNISVSEELGLGIISKHKHFDSNSSPENQIPIKAHPALEHVHVKPNFSGICGATKEDGSLCMRNPLPKRKRCGEHKGMRATMRERSSSVSCGIVLGDGSICSNHPPKGRKRCHVHKGRRQI